MHIYIYIYKYIYIYIYIYRERERWIMESSEYNVESHNEAPCSFVISTENSLRLWYFMIVSMSFGLL